MGSIASPILVCDFSIIQLLLCSGFRDSNRVALEAAIISIVSGMCHQYGEALCAINTIRLTTLQPGLYIYATGKGNPGDRR